MTRRPLHSDLETMLSGTRRTYKWLRFLRFLAILGLCSMAAVLLAGVVMKQGWLTNTYMAVAIFGLIFFLATLALPILAIVVLMTRRSRQWTSDRIEDVHPTLLDRLHTLLFLSQRAPADAEEEAVLTAYGRRIERQALRELVLVTSPFEAEQRFNRRLWLGCLTLLMLTILFYDRYQPMAALRATPQWNEAAVVTEDPSLETPLEDATELREEKKDPAWGEVRITEPGRDLKVTKVDVVPLQIEAATSDPLKEASWLTTLTGAEPREHDLPEPEEPRFAVYTPYLYVDEMRLSDWDVVTYYARAATTGGEYASEVYFLEVRPFREEIEKLTGGGGGQGANLMNECSGLIDRQKHVLRQTHRFLARDGSRQDLDKLIQAEEDLAEASRHLYAKMAAELENQAIGDVLVHLAAAEEELQAAVLALKDDPETAPLPEQSGLAELVATRKSLQKSISDNPSGSGEENDEEPFPIADMPDQLKQISEFRDEEKAAVEMLDKVLEEQRRIARQLEADPSPDKVGALAPEQEASRRQLEQFAEEHPRLFEGARSERQRADETLRSAGEALRQQDPDLAGPRQRGAVAALEDLRRSVGQQTRSSQLRDAYKLKKMLEGQAGQMGEIELEPSGSSGQQAGQVAESAKQTTRELKSMMEDSAMGEDFGPALHQALSEARQQQLERDLDALAEAASPSASPDERGEAARRARQGLEQVSDAFEQSAPQLVRQLREQDALNSSDAEALESALLQLRALLGPEGQEGEDQRREAIRALALRNLRQGLREAAGDPLLRAELLEKAEQALKEPDEAAAARKLRQLLEQLEQFRSELGGPEIEKLELDLAHIDPSKLPAAYRERIQSYFRKLSEQ